MRREQKYISGFVVDAIRRNTLHFKYCKAMNKILPKYKFDAYIYELGLDAFKKKIKGEFVRRKEGAKREMTKCKNCGHKIEDANVFYKEKEGVNYFHARNPHEIGWFGFGIKKTIKHLSLCFCGCTNPEPERGRKAK